MAIQPAIRPAGSSHTLRFVGTLIAGATPQTLNGTVPATAAPTANTPLEIKFALADMTDAAARLNPARRLPASIFDDNQPAGSSPQANTVVGTPGVLPSQNPAGKTWMQNVRVRAQENSATSAAPLIARIDVLNVLCYVDTASTGLNGNTGVPVVGIPFAFTAAGVTAIGTAAAPGAGVPVVIEIEIVDAPTR